jgi:hypothetical protein
MATPAPSDPWQPLTLVGPTDRLRELEMKRHVPAAVPLKPVIERVCALAAVRRVAVAPGSPQANTV